MSRRTRLEWITSGDRSRFPPARQKRRLAPPGRRLHFESLEMRRLLSITVNTLLDENDGIGVGGISLRDAIAAAMPTDTIDFSVTGTINLTHGVLTVNKNLTIDGPGADLLTIDASGNDPTPNVNDGNGSRVFNVDEGDESNLIEVEIGGLTLTGGDENDGQGGAIRNREVLTVRNSIITGNSVLGGGFDGGGGGICIPYKDFLSDPNLTVIGSTISGNSAAANGGGVFGYSSSITISSTTISGNSAGGGGGVGSWASRVTVTDSTISGNMAVSAFGSGGAIKANFADVTVISSTVGGNTAFKYGGGIFTDGGDLIVSSSTISGNSTGKDGGGIFIVRNNGQGGVLTLVNSTISENQAAELGGGVMAGIEVSNFGAVATVTHSTITANNAGDSASAGGGIRVASTASLELDHTIVAGNFRGHSEVSDVQGIVTARYSLIGEDSGAIVTDDGGNRIGTSSSPINPKLGPLADNGGPTKTHALLLGSPALGAGDPMVMAGMGGVPEFDQRGESFSRIVGGRIDIGAYERQPQPLVVDILDDESDGDYTPGDLSLREAIGLSNLQLLPTHTILFDESIWGGAIVLTAGQLNISASVTIEGPGAHLMAIDASGNDPTPDENNGDGSEVFSTAANGVEIVGLTITGADAGGRAAISSLGFLAVTDSIISGNAGGGIIGHYAHVAMTRCTISGNGGTGIRVDFSSLAVMDGTVSDNLGGGISVRFSSAVVSGSTISGNSGEEFGGIGFFYVGNVVVNSSSVTGNASNQNGGGILSVGSGPSIPDLTIHDTTVSGNWANGHGGGIFVERTGYPPSITRSTIANNSADADDDALGTGGGIFLSDIFGASFTDIELDHTIVGGNSRGTAAPEANDTASASSGVLVSRYTLIGVNAGNIIVDNGGNLIGTAGLPIDPLIGPLALNGGLTSTHALLPGSPAIDAGDPTAAAGTDDVPEFDQRGIPWSRVAGGRIDIGALEWQANPVRGDGNFNGIVDEGDYGVWTSGFGSTTDLRGDFNSDAVVDAADYVVWRKNLGQTLPSPSAGEGASAAVTQTLTGAEREYSSRNPAAYHRHPAPPPAVSSTEQPARERKHFRPLLDHVNSRRFHYQPAIRSITGDPHSLAANKRDDALVAWLSCQTEHRGNQHVAFDAAQTTKKTLSEAEHIYTDSLDRVFALLAGD